MTKSHKKTVFFTPPLTVTIIIMLKSSLVETHVFKVINIQIDIFLMREMVFDTYVGKRNPNAQFIFGRPVSCRKCFEVKSEEFDKMNSAKNLSLGKFRGYKSCKDKTYKVEDNMTR